MAAHGNQVNCHGDSDERQKRRDDNRLRRGARRHSASSIQFLHKPQVMPCGEKKNDDSDSDQRGSEPKRQSVSWASGSVLDDLELLQKKAESGDYKAKSHERQAGANPSQESSLGRQQITQVGSWLDLRRLIHVLAIATSRKRS